MRNWISLIESLDRQPPEDVIEYFTTEGCASFAYALFLENRGKGDFVILSDPNDEVDEDWDIDYSPTHVLYSDGSGALTDVRGMQMPDEVQEHFFGDFVDTVDPEDFWNCCVGGENKPLSGDLDTVEQARHIIRQFPDLYGIKALQMESRDELPADIPPQNDRRTQSQMAFQNQAEELAKREGITVLQARDKLRSKNAMQRNHPKARRDFWKSKGG